MRERLRKIWEALTGPSVLNEWPSDRYCPICDGRIWWWQKGTRIYELGMVRSHISCAANFLKSELAALQRGR
jgi:hypothetical protein